jgi:surface antigen
VSDIAHKTSSRRLPAGAPRRYNGTAARWRRHVPAALILALMSGGCSMSYKLDSFFGKKEDEKPVVTGSIAPAAQAALPPEGDLAIAKAAAAEVVSTGAKDASQPWENPQTGARGTVTPIADAYTQDGFLCRDFLASYVRDGSEAWLQGDACRVHKGKWTVRNLRPLKRS